MDVTYTVTLDDAIKGNTDDDLGVYIPSEATAKNDLRNEKKRAYAAMTDMSGVAKSMAVEMKETNRLALESTEALKKKNEF